MSTQTLQGPIQAKKKLIGGTRFDAYFLVTILWLIGGTFADAWAHNHVRRLETFFTPWHAVLYSGLVAFIMGFLTVIFINRQRGASWHEAIPPGYGISLWGMGAMLVIGVGDITWHLLFGIEQNIDALFSPTHLAGMVCIGLVSAGPYRAMYRRNHEPSTLIEKFLLAVALTIILIMIVNESQPASIFADIWPDTYSIGYETQQLAGILSFVFQAIVFTGFSLYTIRRWKLFPGFFTFVLTVIALPLSTMQDRFIMVLVSALAGMLIDAAYFFLQPSVAQATRLRCFAVIAAAALYAVYILVLELTTKVVWTVHLATGSVVVVGIAGWLLTYLVVPGKQPEPRGAEQ